MADGTQQKRAPRDPSHQVQPPERAPESIAGRTPGRTPAPAPAGGRPDAILDAALEVFSLRGFDGATLDLVAAAAGLSKSHLLYYFPSKAAIHLALLQRLLDAWLAPLRALDPAGEPVAEVLGYVRRKLAMSRDMPRESRLFAHEVMRGAPQLGPVLEGELRGLVEEKGAVLLGWMEEGRIARLPPAHLLISVWALTQHYADFDAQVRVVLGPGAGLPEGAGAADGRDPFAEAEGFLATLFERLLRP